MSGEERENNFAGRTSTPRFDATFIITTVTILMALAFLVYRTLENERLKSELAGLRGQLARFSGDIAGIPTLQTGDIVPVVAAKNLRGEAKILNYEQSVKSLIFIFSVECDACKAQFPQWNRLANQSQSNGFQVVGIVVNRPEVAKRGLVNQEARFEILIPDDFAIQRAFRSASLPLTVIVSSQGRVEWFKYGVLSDKDYQKISSLLQTQ